MTDRGSGGEFTMETDSPQFGQPSDRGQLKMTAHTHTHAHARAHTHTHTRLMALCP